MNYHKKVFVLVYRSTNEPLSAIPCSDLYNGVYYVLGIPTSQDELPHCFTSMDAAMEAKSSQKSEVGKYTHRFNPDDLVVKPVNFIIK